jgi:hypothetical protein
VAPRPLTQARVDALVARLDLDLDVGICHLCLLFVCHALDEGNPRAIAGTLRRMAPHIWHEGLAEPALDAVRRACAAGVPDAEGALADLEQHGGRSVVARAIVKRLAAMLSRRMRTDARLLERARDRLEQAPPDLN